MNKSTLRSVTLMLLLGGLGNAPSAFAVPLVDELMMQPYRTDVYLVVCPMGTVQAEGWVRDIAPAAMPRIRMAMAKFPGAQVVEAPQEAASGLIAVADGPGAYHIMVYKNDLFGAEQYEGSVVCLDAMDAGLAPAVFSQTQDQ